MLLASSYFGSIKHQLGWVISGTVVAALIGYVVVEMILRKTWHIMSRKLPLEFAVYSVLLGVLLYVPVSGITGYENRVPQNDEVTAVYAGGNYGGLTENSQGTTTRKERENEILSTDRKYIEAVTALHQAIVTSRPDQQSTPRYDYTGSRQFTLAYKLKNGRKLLRTYLVPAAGFEPELKAVMGNTDFKREKYLLSRLEQNMESFRLSYLNKVFSISDPQEVQEFNEILKRELLNMSYEDQVNNQRGRASIQLVEKPNSTGYQIYYTYEWFPSYHEMTAWLEQKGYADKLKVTAQDVLSAEIFRDEHQSEIPSGLIYDPDTRLKLARSEKRSAVVSDKGLIDGILEHQRNFTGQEGFNPSIRSGELGHHYANPRNNFWRILHNSGLTPRLYDASEDGELLKLGYGFTNIVARPTVGAEDITREEYAQGRELLRAKLALYRPEIACFVGKGVYTEFSRRTKAGWGFQEGVNPVVDRVREFVAPSSSGLVRMPMPEIVDIYRKLHDFTEEKET
ncbi:hypothetical protein KC345_g9256 [Hortaea werneckii]|nr:hypothetical protein KC345_g9256 [Hortaea werneckii]